MKLQRLNMLKRFKKISKILFKVITNACVKIAVLEIFSEKKTREPVIGTFKKCFAGLCQ